MSSATSSRRVVYILTILALLLSPLGNATSSATSVLSISNVSDTPDSFSPNGDNRYDTTQISFTLSASASVTVKVLDSAGTVVRTLWNAVPQSNSSLSVDWDGRNTSGSIVADGVYSYTIDAADGAGNQAVQQSGSVMVDNRKPLTLISPAPGTTLAGSVTLIATPLADYTVSSVYFTWQRAEGGSGNIGSAVKQTNGTWMFTWDTQGVVNGTYEIRTQQSYTDSRGSSKNTITSVGTFTINNAIALTNVSDAPDSFSPNGDGQYDTTRINVTLSTNANVTVKLLDSDTTVVRTLWNSQAKTAGTLFVDWDGKNDAGTVVADGVYSYTIDAVDGAGNQAVQQSGSVMVDNRKPLTLTSPAPGTTLAGSVTLVATPLVTIPLAVVAQAFRSAA